MNRATTYLLLIVGCVVTCAGVAAFGDYYDVLFGRPHHSAWDVVENDTGARMETRALWGAAGGACLGVVVTVWSALKRRGGKPDETSNDASDDAEDG